MNYNRLPELIERKLKCSGEETLAFYILKCAMNCPDTAALEWFDEDKGCINAVTYRQLAADILALGAAFHAKALSGKTLALSGKTGYYRVLSFITCLFCDIITVPLDPSLTSGELKKKLLHCRADLLIADDDVAKKTQDISDFTVIPTENVSEMLSYGRDLIKNGDNGIADIPVPNNARCLILFTSGTGGKMKAAVLRQENLSLERFVWEGLGVQGGKSLLILPLFHIAGIKNLYGCLMAGGTLYLSSGLKYLTAEYAYVKPVHLFCVPAQAELICSLLEGKSCEEGKKLLGGSLELIRTSGAPLSESIRDRLHPFGIETSSDYGMTEAGGPVAVTFRKNGSFVSKAGAVGHILDCIDVRIVSPDINGNGEIVISGQCVFDGYLGDIEETNKVIRNGSIYTGDIGYIDDEGFLYIRGRTKNVIILSSGENVIPEELEKEIMKINGVHECLVFSDTDKIATAIYAPKACDSEHERLIAELRRLNSSLPSWKRIGRFIFTKDPLPRTSTGKLLRNGLYDTRT